ncbi:MAG: alcohol dehydrogenase, partial [Pseudomonadota bacterium]
MGLPDVMTAVRLSGYGGLDKLEYRTDVPTPRPRAGEVVVRVTAAGMNNTDINTRIGWYSKTVTGATDATGDLAEDDPSWGGAAIEFPRIQGADICGKIVGLGPGVAADRLGER